MGKNESLPRQGAPCETGMEMKMDKDLPFCVSSLDPEEKVRVPPFLFLSVNFILS